MHSIQKLRKKDPQLRAALSRRPTNIDWDSFDAQEHDRSQARQAYESALAGRRRVAEQVGQMRRQGASSDDQALLDLLASGQGIAASLGTLSEEADRLDAQQQAWVNELPNAPLACVPDGATEDLNSIVEVVGEPRSNEPCLDHAEIASRFYGYEPECAANLSGSRFSVLRGPIARLHRALVQMMLDIHEQDGYEELYVPYLVRGQTLFGTGQLPKFEEDLFKTQGDLYLIPTAEVPVTNLVRGRVLKASEVPLAWMAHTPCFRREAGSAGKDSSGLIRQHQFDKVELVRIEHPDRSEQALVENVLAGAQKVLQALELPYRVVELCTGDLGFSSQHTYDIEVWMPAQNTYREISSCSNMGEFQARRMNVKLIDGNQKIYPHTLNGSGLAVGRSLAAVLENHIQGDGGLYIPERLRPFMSGKPYIFPSKR